MGGLRRWEKTDGFLDGLVEKRVQVGNMDGHGNQWLDGMDGLNWVNEIELDNISVDGQLGDWNGFGNWFDWLMGNIGLHWDELDGRLRLVRFDSDGLGDNNWFFLDDLLLLDGRLLERFATGSAWATWPMGSATWISTTCGSATFRMMMGRVRQPAHNRQFPRSFQLVFFSLFVQTIAGL